VSAPVAPSLDRWHDIDDFDFPDASPGLLLTEQEALTSNFTRLYSPFLRLSSELLRNRNSTKGLFTRYARSEDIPFYPDRPESPP
jgi:hypothetical protein